MTKARRSLLVVSAILLPSIAIFGQDSGVYSIGNGVSAPIAVQQVNPSYTPEAREARVQGTVRLEAVVTSEGSVSNVRVVSGLGYGLDESAANALSQWRFKPGTKDGTAVNVKIAVTMNFNLR